MAVRPRRTYSEDRRNAGPVLVSAARAEAIFLLLVALLTAFVAIGHLRPYFARAYIPDDLGAFYCGGKVALQRQDPYRTQPLLDCERRLGLDRRWLDPRIDAVSSVPLPGYDFVPLMALAALPMRPALALFACLLLAAALLIAYALSRMTALPLSAAAAVAFMGGVYFASALGQLSPFAIAAVAVAALLFRSGRHRLAAVAASAALLQPHVGVPVIVAVFAFVPRARAVLVTVAVTLLALSIAAVGTRGVSEYRSVLAVTAPSEINAPYQYSLSWFAHQAGATSSAALALGAASSLVLLAGCLAFLARRRAWALESGAIVMLPAAVSVAGGTYVHVHQIGVALLAAIVLPSTMLGAALLAVPFPAFALGPNPTPTVIPSVALTLIAVWCVVFFPTRAAARASPARTASIITAIVAALLVVFFVARPLHQYAAVTTGITIVHQRDAFAALEDRQAYDAIATRDTTPLWYYLLVKAPTWLGLMLTLWFGARAGGNPCGLGWTHGRATFKLRLRGARL